MPSTATRWHARRLRRRSSSEGGGVTDGEKAAAWGGGGGQGGGRPGGGELTPSRGEWSDPKPPPMGCLGFPFSPEGDPGEQRSKHKGSRMSGERSPKNVEAKLLEGGIGDRKISSENTWLKEKIAGIP